MVNSALNLIVYQSHCILQMIRIYFLCFICLFGNQSDLLGLIKELTHLAYLFSIKLNTPWRKFSVMEEHCGRSNVKKHRNDRWDGNCYPSNIINTDYYCNANSHYERWYKAHLAEIAGFCYSRKHTLRISTVTSLV